PALSRTSNMDESPIQAGNRSCPPEHHSTIHTLEPNDCSKIGTSALANHPAGVKIKTDDEMLNTENYQDEDGGVKFVAAGKPVQSRQWHEIAKDLRALDYNWPKKKIEEYPSIKPTRTTVADTRPGVASKVPVQTNVFKRPQVRRICCGTCSTCSTCSDSSEDEEQVSSAVKPEIERKKENTNKPIAEEAQQANGEGKYSLFWVLKGNEEAESTRLEQITIPLRAVTDKDITKQYVQDAVEAAAEGTSSAKQRMNRPYGMRRLRSTSWEPISPRSPKSSVGLPSYPHRAVFYLQSISARAMLNSTNSRRLSHAASEIGSYHPLLNSVSTRGHKYDQINREAAVKAYRRVASLALIWISSMVPTSLVAIDFSKASEIATTSTVLLSGFQDCALSILYKIGITDFSISPEELRENSRRLLDVYALQVRDGVGDAFVILVLHSVLWEVGDLAQAVIDNLIRSGQADHLLHGPEDSPRENRHNNAYQVNNTASLIAVQEWLNNLPYQIQAFALPEIPPLMLVDTKAKLPSMKEAMPLITTEAHSTRGVQVSSSWAAWLNGANQSLHLLSRKINAWSTSTWSIFVIIMSQFGLLEGPLQPGMSRLRWQCPCGETHFTDVLEIREGGVMALVAQMRLTSGARVSVTPSGQQVVDQQYKGIHPLHRLQNAVTKLFRSLYIFLKPKTGLPHFNNSCSTAKPIPLQPRKLLHLLSCMHRGRSRKVLLQERLDEVTTDRTLVHFLRQQYRHHGSLLPRMRLKSIKGVSFVKLLLPIGGSVVIQHHNPYCAALPAAPSACECIPPKAKVEPSSTAEYRCIPGPPATQPPIPPEYFASLLNCPIQVHEQDIWILNQLPKRICGKLQGEIGKPAGGWGIYYQEGWDQDLIILTIFLLFLLGSLLFGVLWSRYRFDVQGAFSISAYMVGASAVLITVIVTWTEKI
ncbi:hypothetical protein J1614_007712, partial [Plenodomus biglobosus]